MSSWDREGITHLFNQADKKPTNNAFRDIGILPDDESSRICPLAHNPCHLSLGNIFIITRLHSLGDPLVLHCSLKTFERSVQRREQIVDPSLQAICSFAAGTKIETCVKMAHEFLMSRRGPVLSSSAVLTLRHTENTPRMVTNSLGGSILPTSRGAPSPVCQLL